MKKQLAVGLAFFSLTFTAQAQNWSFGPELGTNAIMVEKTDLGRDYHLCWYAGANVEYQLTDFFSLRSGVYFSQRKKMYQSADTTSLSVFGFDLEDFGLSGVDFSVYSQTKGIVSLFGMEVPALATFNFKEVSFFAGPYMNFLVGAWSKERTDEQIPFLQTFNMDSLDPSGIISSLFPPPTSSTFTESSSVENMRGFDFGFKTGMSYTHKSFRMNFYYTFGVPDYRIDKGVDHVNAHQYATVSVAYNFKAGPSGISSFGD
ncbi:MAG: outer membrane beta-barrel protein [Bacteroidetes bacterium]|nr:outer membrane beta-barrel protein [Bacteroidota bacterium]